MTEKSVFSGNLTNLNFLKSKSPIWNISSYFQKLGFQNRFNLQLHKKIPTFSRCLLHSTDCTHKVALINPYRNNTYVHNILLCSVTFSNTVDVQSVLFWHVTICFLLGNFPAISDDLVNSYHLLLCCLDLFYSNALATRHSKDMIDPDFEGIGVNVNQLCFQHGKTLTPYGAFNVL